MPDSLLSYSKGYGQGGPGRLGKYYVQLLVGKYKRRTPFEQGELDFDKSIYLPLPMEMRDDTVVGYGNQDTGLVGNVLDNGLGAGSNIAAEMLRQSGAMITGAAESLGGGAMGVLGNLPFASLVASTAGNFLKDALPPESITSGISQSLGVAPNPNPSVIFQGPRLREMNLNWMLIPTNDQDSRNIRKLVNYLKGAALPKNTIKDSAAILEYPHLVRVNFFPWDNGGIKPFGWTENSIIKMKHCFMSSVNVNYTAGNVPAFYEGTNEPVVVGLSINFTEVEYFLANDYDASVNAGATDNLIELITNRVTGVTERVGTELPDIEGLSSDLLNAAGT